MEKASDSDLNASSPSFFATVEDDRLDENNALILHRTPERGFVEGDTIVWDRRDGTREALYIEGVTEHGDVQLVLKIHGKYGDRAQYADFRLRFRDQTVAYPIIPDRTKALIDASQDA